MINKHQVFCGDLFLVDFDPSAGHEYQGKRPALVIESDEQIKKSNLITIVPLTSNLENKIDDDILVEVDGDNRLQYDSIIKVYDIISFDYPRFINYIGKINQESTDKVKEYLKKHFGL